MAVLISIAIFLSDRLVCLFNCLNNHFPLLNIFEHPASVLNGQIHYL